MALIGRLQAQDKLYVNEEVTAMYITIPEDTLNLIYTDIYSDIYRMADLVYVSSVGRDSLAQVGIRLRGNTSRSAHKKSFKIKTNEFIKGQKLHGYKKVNLRASHNDATMVREKLYYDLWNQAGMVRRESNFCKLYINNRYYGLYTNIEEMDGDWLKKTFQNPDGNLYKNQWPADMKYISDSAQDYKNIMNGDERAYELKTNENADNYADLVELIKLLNKPSQPGWADSVQLHLDMESLLKSYALEVLAGHWDNYGYNKNNYYLYHNPADNKFYFISYDADNTYGIDWVNRDWSARDVKDWLNHGESRPMLENPLKVPLFNAQYLRYLDSFSHILYDTSSVFPQIDAYKALIQPHIVSDSFARLDYNYTYTDWEKGFVAMVDNHSPYGIKPFIARRLSFAKTQNPSTLGLNKSLKNVLNVYPNPCTDILNMSSSLPYKIFNIQGKQVLEGIGYKIDVSLLPYGLYTILTHNSVLRFIKE